MTDINELVIRIPATDGVDPVSLGNEVAQRIAETLPADIGTHFIPEVNISIAALQSSDTSAWSERIAEQIIQHIKIAILK